MVAYTKKEMAQALGFRSERPCDLTKKLKKMGVEFRTEGRGDSYRIVLEEELKGNYNDKQLGMMWAIENGFPTSNIYGYGQTEEKYLEMYGEEVSELEESYYAVGKKIVSWKDDVNYMYYMDYRQISFEEWEKAMEKANAVYRGYMEDYDSNPDKILEEAQYLYVIGSMVDGYRYMKRAKKREIKEEFRGLGRMYCVLKEGNLDEDFRKEEERKEEWENLRRKRREDFRKKFGDGAF